MAEEFVAYRGLDDTPCRFDVVGVDLSVNPPRIAVYKDAFRPGW
jgi:Holliday junction resolvase-like predicted endonuclease